MLHLCVKREKRSADALYTGALSVCVDSCGLLAGMHHSKAITQSVSPRVPAGGLSLQFREVPSIHPRLRWRMGKRGEWGEGGVWVKINLSLSILFLTVLFSPSCSLVLPLSVFSMPPPFLSLKVLFTAITEVIFM